jgi:hypothetical protein
MFINITPKKLDKGYEVSATFEHYGVAYEERFRKVAHFKRKLKSTKDRFINAVDYSSMSVVSPKTVYSYLN